MRERAYKIVREGERGLRPTLQFLHSLSLAYFIMGGGGGMRWKVEEEKGETIYYTLSFSGH